LGSEFKASISGHVRIPGARFMGNILVKCDVGESVLETKTQWDGSYEFKDLEGSKHIVTVEVKGYAKQTKEIKVSRSDDKMVVDFDMVEAKGTGSISGHVYDGLSKAPITQGHVSLVLPGGNKYAELNFSGHYEFTGLPADNYEIWAAPSAMYVNQQAKLVLAEAETKTQDFYLEPGQPRIW
jgi:hypothetical protein